MTKAPTKTPAKAAPKRAVKASKAGKAAKPVEPAQAEAEPADVSWPEYVNAPTLAALMGCDKRTIEMAANKGIIPRIGRGKYPFEQGVRAYVSNLRERAAGRESDDGKVSAVTEGAMLKQAQRRLVDLKFNQLEGQLISLPELEEAWSALVIEVRQLFMSFPSRALFDMPHLPPEDQRTLTELAETMLKEVALKGKPKLPETKTDVDVSDV